MEINTEKTKIMSFCGKYPVPSKICINNKIIERVNEITQHTLDTHYPFLMKLSLIKCIDTMGII